jgi:hypothetical protein
MSGEASSSSSSSWLDKKMSREKVSYTLPTAMPNYFADPPKKYAKSHSSSSKGGGGLIKLNPDWKQWKEECHQKEQQQQQQQGTAAAAAAGGTTATTTATATAAVSSSATTTTNSNPNNSGSNNMMPATSMTTTALPVVTSMADHYEMNEISLANGGLEVPLSESTNATIELFQQPDISHETGLTSATAMDQIGLILSKYEVPIGLMNKLMLLAPFDLLEFIIDDSGSMLHHSDTVHPITGEPVTRWEEAKVRLLEMMELLAYLPFQMATVIFLNRPTKLSFTRKGRDPTTLYQEMVQEITRAFTPPPNGTTPFLEKLQTSFQTHQGKSVARWFFGDGIPNGGLAAQEQITDLLQNRAQPSLNPVTLISCTNEDGEVQWMKDCEEVAPYCSEADDYQDEAAEVLRDQGEALPYTRGFHLVCQLVAAQCPDDLDAMDESVPLTKPTLDNLLGLQHTEPAYQYYFDAFLAAQQKRTVEKYSAAVDHWKKQMNWTSLYRDYFLTTTVANQIPAVQNYLTHLKELEQAAADAAMG